MGKALCIVILYTILPSVTLLRLASGGADGPARRARPRFPKQALGKAQLVWKPGRAPLAGPGVGAYAQLTMMVESSTTALPLTASSWPTLTSNPKRVRSFTNFAALALKVLSRRAVS